MYPLTRVFYTFDSECKALVDEQLLLLEILGDEEQWSCGDLQTKPNHNLHNGGDVTAVLVIGAAASMAQD